VVEFWGEGHNRGELGDEFGVDIGVDKFLVGFVAIPIYIALLLTEILHNRHKSQRLI
jgi:hypothetical protein